MKKVLLPIMIVSMLFLLFGCAAQSRTIELKGNVTTGYLWQYTMSEQGIVAETSNAYEDGNIPGTTGAGGVFQFTFEGIAPGETDLYFEYIRPWEEGIEPASTVTYHIVVNQNNQIAGCKPVGATVHGQPLKEALQSALAE